MLDQLTKDDLVLLMESYRNMITMHQTILDQTNKTIDKLDVISTKQDSLFSKQGNLCSSLDNIMKKVVDSSINIKTNNTKVDDLKSGLIEKLNNHEIRSTEDHGKLTNKIYIGWVGMISIIIALIGLGLTLIHNTPIIK